MGQADEVSAIVASASAAAAAAVQPKGPPPQDFPPTAHQMLAATSKPSSLNAHVEAFLVRWRLDSKCAATLKSLPHHAQRDILETFRAHANTRDTSAKFMSWLTSKMRSNDELQSCLSTSLQERQEFYERWHLDFKCRELVEAQPPFVQRELIANFKPPAGTLNMAGKMTAFLKMICCKTGHRQSSGRSSPSSADLAQFASSWGLDTGARSALVRLSPELQEAAIKGFKPRGRPDSFSKKFIAYLKSFQTNAATSSSSWLNSDPTGLCSEPRQGTMRAAHDAPFAPGLQPAHSQ